MASKNETVNEAIDAVLKMIHDCPAIKGGEVKHEVKKVGGLFCISLPEKDRIEMTNAELAGHVEKVLPGNLWLIEAAKRLRQPSEGDGRIKTELVKIIEYIIAGNKEMAIAYAEHLIKNCERKYEQTKDIFDKYEIMGARNILHMLKGEPKEGGVAVCD